MHILRVRRGATHPYLDKERWRTKKPRLYQIQTKKKCVLGSKAVAWKVDAQRCTRLKVKLASPGGKSRLGLEDQVRAGPRSNTQELLLSG